MLYFNISDVIFITVKNVDYHCIIHDISKSEAIYLLKNFVLENRDYIKKIQIKEINIRNRVYNYYLYGLIKAKKLETKNILIDKKNYKYMVIYFTRYVHSKSIKMLNLHHELIRKVEEDERKKLHG